MLPSFVYSGYLFVSPFHIFQHITYPTDYTPFRTHVEEYLATQFPHYEGLFQLTDQEKTYLTQYNQFIFDLQLVADNHEMYDLHRAMHQAEEILHDISEEMISKWLLPQSNMLEKKLHNEHDSLVRIQQDVRRLRQLQVWKERVMLRKAKAFKLLSYLVSTIDIIIPVILIVFISHIAHLGDHLFETVIGNIIFISVLALLKVVLDRFRIIPFVDSMGWKWYRQRVNELTDFSSRLVGIVFLMSRMNDNDYPAGEVLETLEQGIGGLE